MNLKRRLQNLECRPFRRPVSQRDDFVVAPVLAEALRLMVAAQARTRINLDDTGGWDGVRDYALSLHTKYGTATWGD